MAKWQAKLLQLHGMVSAASSQQQLHTDALRKVVNATISICGKSRRWDWSLHLVNAMELQAGPVPLPKPDVISYGAVISILGRTMRWQQALLLLDECDNRKMVKASAKASVKVRPGVKSPEVDRVPDLICFNSALAACGKGLQWLKACTLLIAMTEKKVRPDTVSISTLITTLGNAMHWQLALWYFSRYHFSYPAALSPSAASTSRVEDHEGCSYESNESIESQLFQPFQPFQPSHHRSHKKFHAFILSSAISACEKGRQWEAALLLLAGAAKFSDISAPASAASSFRSSSFFPDFVCFNAAIVACEGCSQWELAVQVLSQMSWQGTPGATSYATTIKAMSAARRWQHAIALLSSSDRLDGFGWVSLFAALHVEPEHLCAALRTMLGMRNSGHSRYSRRQGRQGRQGVEQAESLGVTWMRVLGVSDSSASARLLRYRALSHAYVLNRGHATMQKGQHYEDGCNLEWFVGDILEYQGFRYWCASAQCAIRKCSSRRVHVCWCCVTLPLISILPKEALSHTHVSRKPPRYAKIEFFWHSHLLIFDHFGCTLAAMTFV